MNVRLCVVASLLSLTACGGAELENLIDTSVVEEKSVIFEKHDTYFSLDGNRGAIEGQAIYLIKSDGTNVNQQWIEEHIIDNYSAYRKADTNLCIDGGVNATNGQAVTLEICDSTNQSQHWLKVALSNSAYRFKNRDSGLSIDSQKGAEDYQEIHLWKSDDDNGNQQWHQSTQGIIPVIVDPSNITVSTLEALREAIENSNSTIFMEAGNYNLSSLEEGSRNLIFSGSNNTIDLTDVYIEVPVGSTASRESYVYVDGDNNTIIGGEFEDTYNQDIGVVTDFVSYNQDRSLASGLKGEAVMTVNGSNNTFNGIKLTVRGSFPYGYGSIFGINQDSSFSLSKRCGMVIKGPNTVVDNAEVQMRSFCHGIYMQEDADNTIILNTLVEGRVRETNDMLAEGESSLPYQENYLDVDGNPILPNEVNSLSEDGIRAYNGTGTVRVENSVVKNMRGGYRLYLGGQATIINSVALDNGNTNFNLSANSTVTGSSGNFTNGPLNDHNLGRSRQNIEMTIIASPDAIGAHNITDIKGNSHEIVFHREAGPIDSGETRAIVVYGNNSTIRNETEYKIILEPGTRGNTIISAGEVTDNGDNDVSSIELVLD